MRPFSIKIVCEAGVLVELQKEALDRRAAFIDAVSHCVAHDIQPESIKVRPTKPVRNQSE